MSNQILFCSSVAILIIQIFSILYFGTPFLFSTIALLAAFTSILNHGFTSTLLKMIDRTYIPIYIVCNTVIIFFEIQDALLLCSIYAIMLTGIVAVIYAIAVGNVLLHLFSHFVLITVHLIMCYNFK